MPWLSIIVFIITFFFSKKKGASDTEAALWGLGAAGLTYFAADPANPDNWFGIDADTPILGNLAPGQAVPNGSGLNQDTTSAGVGSTSSWWSKLPGYVGAAAIGAGLSGTVAKWLPWAAGGLAAYLLLRKKKEVTYVVSANR
jgi:hypothetical protein